MSRIDRIYANLGTGRFLSNCKVEPSEIPSDHRMILVCFAPQHAPFIGTGCWSWPLGLLHDKTLNESIHTCGLELQRQFELLPQNDRSMNVQTLWQRFKDEIMSKAKVATKLQLCKITNHISALQKDLKESKRSITLDENESSCINVIALE